MGYLRVGFCDCGDFGIKGLRGVRFQGLGKVEGGWREFPTRVLVQGLLHPTYVLASPFN